MKTLHLLLILFFVSPLFMGCGGDDPVATQYDVYAYGNYNDKACYWKNGELIDLGTEAGSSVYCGAITGEDIYLGGFNFSANGVHNGGTVWKNGSPTYITGLTVPEALIVSGSDVYIAGRGGDNSALQAAMFWKNGQGVVLEHSSNFIQTNGIAVSGTDVHVVGFEAKGDSILARYWKNGVSVKLPIRSKETFLHAVGISGSNVYIVGSDNSVSNIPHSVYWKNGLYTNAAKIGELTKIIVSGSDVYFAGVGGYWLNENFINITADQYASIDIAQINNDLFLATQGISTGVSETFTVTKNGKVLSPFNGTSTTNMYLHGILVKEK